jgi:MFS family permease
VSFAAFIVPLALIDRSRLYPPPRLPKGGTPVRDGLRYVRDTPIMLATFVVFVTVSTFGFNYNVSLPRMAAEVWDDERWYGWMLAAISLGSMLGALATAGRQHVSIRWMAGTGFLLGAAGIGLAWSSNPWVALLVSIPVGLGGAGFVASMNAITQQECPPVMRGRIMALTAVAFLGSYPIGGPITGIIGDQISVQWSLCYGAIITVVATAGLVWWALGRAPEASRFEALRNMLGASAAAGPNPGEHP